MKLWRIFSLLLIAVPWINIEASDSALAQKLPCALLALTVPPEQLPKNPSVVDPSFQPLLGAQAFAGEYACSGYRIEVPKNWNGDLVLYAHGFRGASSALTVTNLPIRQAALSQGFAWAASSYRVNGYNPQAGVKDTLLLADLFKQKVGVPKRIFLYGSSMGGQVVVNSLESHADVYAGGVSECGTISGAGQLDYMIQLNTLADYFAKTDMFAPPKRSLLSQHLSIQQKIYPALGRSSFVYSEANMLMGEYNPVPPIDLTPQGQAFRNAAIYLSGGDRPFAEAGFAASYQLAIEGPRLLLALLPTLAQAATNDATKYQIDRGYGISSQDINAGVRRVAASPLIRSQFAVTGNLKAPLLTIHGTGDGFVPITNQKIYRQLVKAAGKSDLLVQRGVRRFVHCDFSLAERTHTFNDLTKWVKNGVKPAGEDFSGSLKNIGKKWTEPLRPDDRSQK
jgi:pimeloyl-ACP methyl ester carboxylesterase